MTDTLALEYAIKKSGKTLKSVAEALEISYNTFWAKAHNVSEFKVSQVLKIQEFCSLSNDERDAIFYAQKGEKISRM